MGNFKRNNRSGGGGFDRGNRSDSRSGGRNRDTGRFSRNGDRGGGRDRDSGRFEKRLEMFDTTCDKCGKRCQVPFKPTGSKPVFCSDCFRQNEGENGSSSRFESRTSAPSSDQLNIINAKLDKIITVLEELEIIQEDADSEDDSDEEE
ncbi:hypothetical protein J4205_02600 [Candidatus Pacearchaeota archaeon]|nr:hypothetical protein [Candidatus Pacearchaeota archaeon]